MTCFGLVAIGCSGGDPPVKNVEDTGDQQQFDTNTDQDTGYMPPDTGGDDEDTGRADTGSDQMDTGGDQMDTGGDQMDTGMDQDTSPCPKMGEEQCNGTCVNTNVSLDHCGDCNQGCPDLPNTSKSCVDGNCDYSCVMGYTDADGDLSDPMNSNGCEQEGSCTPTAESCNGKDDDCDGQVDEEWSDKLGEACEAGMGECKVSGTNECNPNGPGVVCSKQPPTPPESPEEKTCDGKDNDCDGTTDEGCDDDGDGICDRGMNYTSSASCQDGPNGGLDCDDNDDEVYPGHPGACDGKDNDCDGNSDEVEPLKKAKTYTASGIKEKNGWGKNNNGALATPTDDGFCAAFLHKDHKKIQFVEVKQGGVKTHQAKISNHEAKDLVDIAWSGSDCAVVYRRPDFGTPDDLWVMRWDVSGSNDHAVRFEKSDKGDARGSSGVYFSSRRNDWVLVSFSTPNFGADKVKFKTLPANFKGSDDPNKIKDYGVRDTPWLDVGPSPSGSDDFAAVTKGKHGITPEWQVRTHVLSGSSYNEVNSMRFKQNAININSVVLNEAGGKTFGAYVDSTKNEWVVREFESGPYSWGATSRVTSNNDRNFPSRDLFTEAPNNELWFMDPHRDVPYTFAKAGNKWSFNRMNHPKIGSDDELIAIRGDQNTDRLEVLSLTDTQPYKVQINAWTCY